MESLAAGWRQRFCSFVQAWETTKGILDHFEYLVDIRKERRFCQKYSTALPLHLPAE